jgi:RNA polymerase sigma factor (TIGR02999 family)
MMGPGEITGLLREWRAGDRAAEARLFEMLMPELRKIASASFRNERPGHTLQPTALINEAFLRLVKARTIDWQDRGHFLALAAKVMRRFLIDHARARPAVHIVPLEHLPPEVVRSRSELEMVVIIDALLDELERESPEQRAAVELKFLLGLTDAEAAETLHLTLHTFQRQWHRARKWLFEKLTAMPCQTKANKTSA